MVGGGANRPGAGMHYKAADGTPIANVMLSLLHHLGVTDIDSFGDSTGPFTLSGPAATTQS